MFLDFVKEVDGLKFSECPDYNRLRRLLFQVITNNGLALTNEYDWSPKVEGQSERILVPTNSYV